MNPPSRRLRWSWLILLGTNFPPELYDGHLFGKESYYEELAKQQKVEMDKREKVGVLFPPSLFFPDKNGQILAESISRVFS